jgi:predicted permease
MANVWQDVRYALRLLAKTPGFTLTAILSLALGIGATTAVFSVIHAVLVSPYPYTGADRMVRVATEDRSGLARNFFLTGPQFRDFQQLQSVESAIGQQNWEAATTGNDLPEDVRVVFFTANATTHFGVPALLGRGLLPTDAAAERGPGLVAVLSFSFWRRHFGGRSDVVGKTFSMGHQDFTIVGVLPSRFAWTVADVYLPLRITNDPKQLLWVSCVKLKLGVSAQAAEVEVDALLQNFAKQTPEHFPENFRVRVKRLTDERDVTFVHTLYLLFAAVALMLLIGCANFSILLLALGTSRQQELAVRSAIGASRGRVLSQLLVESLLLSLGGAAFGVAAAYAAVALIANWLPRAAFPAEVAIRINVPVLAFTVVLALLVGLIFGLAPALRLSRTEGTRLLLPATPPPGFGGGANHVYAALVAAQVALTLLLLSVGGAATEGFLTLMRVPLGYDPHNTLVIGIPLQDNTYMTWEQRAAYFAQLRQHLAAIPGIASAAITTRATPPADGLQMRVIFSGRADTPGAANTEQQNARVSMVSAEYFSVLRTPLLAGRIWDQAETMRAAPVAVVNETMARLYWPKGDALGQTLRLPDLTSKPFRLVPASASQRLQVIGVVADARNDGIGQAVQPAIYVPYTFDLEVYTEILIRTDRSLAAVYNAARKEVRNVDAGQQVEGHGEIVSLEAIVTRQNAWRQAHLATILLGAFGLLALVLASVGLYGVVSYSVARRTNEFGIRIALGAQSRDVLRLVFSSAASSIAFGLVAGILLSFYAAKLVAHWTEVSPSNPIVLLNATAVFLAAAAVACLIPARRATCIDPLEALRRE